MLGRPPGLTPPPAPAGSVHSTDTPRHGCCEHLTARAIPHRQPQTHRPRCRHRRRTPPTSQTTPSDPPDALTAAVATSSPHIRVAGPSRAGLSARDRGLLTSSTAARPFRAAQPAIRSPASQPGRTDRTPAPKRPNVDRDRDGSRRWPRLPVGLKRLDARRTTEGLGCIRHGC